MMAGSNSDVLVPAESNSGRQMPFRVTVAVGTVVLVFAVGLTNVARKRATKFDDDAIIMKYSEKNYYTKCPGSFLAGFPSGDKGAGQVLSVDVAKLWCKWNIECTGVTCDTSGRCTLRYSGTFHKSLTQEISYWRQSEEPMSADDRAPNCPAEPAASTLMHPGLQDKLVEASSIPHQRANFVATCVSDFNVTNNDGLGIDESVLKWIHGFQWIDMCRNYFDEGIKTWDPFNQKRARPTRNDLLKLATMKNIADAEWWVLERATTKEITCSS